MSKFSFQEEQQPIYKSYEQEILFLKVEAGILLEQIKEQEIKLYEAKRRNLQVNPNNVNTLEQMIRKFLRMLALMDGYRFFQSKNQAITNLNSDWFYFITDGCFSNRLQQFLEELHIRVNQR